MNDQLKQLIDRALPEIKALRQELHANPELSMKEFRTSKRIRESLAKLPNLKVLPPLLETDVVAVLNENKPGPCIALRADIDALPIIEENEVPYKSTVPGVMHACGHDGHTATLVGAVTVLSQMADQLPGKVKFIFQPAEEDQGGADKLCEKGVLDSPKVDAAIALHAWPQQPAGTIALRRGPVTAANNEIVITVTGKGGHGAYPHRCVDPIVIASQIVLGLQTIVARNVPPLDAAVVTIGEIKAGSATNIIPPDCRMRGTIRYYRKETGEMMRDKVRAIAENIARAHGGEAEVAIRLGYPSLLNDDKLAAFAEKTAVELLGSERVVTTEDPSMGAEDFAFYAQHVPGMMFRLGVRPPEMDTYPGLHHPRFNFNDDSLATGMLMFCELTQRFLTKPPT